MEIRFIILCFIAALMQRGAQAKQQKRKTALNAYETEAVKRSFFIPYEIEKNEVRDTSFVLPRKLLDYPEDFFWALTEAQMINRVWTDSYNYTEKLLFGDSIFRKICKEVADSKRTPIFLIDEIHIGERYFYYLDVKKAGDRLCTYYGLREDGVRESTWKMTEFYRDLLDEWNKEDMFKIGWTDESKKIVTHRPYNLLG